MIGYKLVKKDGEPLIEKMSNKELNKEPWPSMLKLKLELRKRDDPSIEYAVLSLGDCDWARGLLISDLLSLSETENVKPVKKKKND